MPAQLGRRYSPLVLLVAAQLVLAAVAPSIPGSAGGNALSTSGSATSGQAGAEAAQGGAAGGGADTTGTGPSGGAGGSGRARR